MKKNYIDGIVEAGFKTTSGDYANYVVMNDGRKILSMHGKDGNVIVLNCVENENAARNSHGKAHMGAQHLAQIKTDIETLHWDNGLDPRFIREFYWREYHLNNPIYNAAQVHHEPFRISEAMAMFDGDPKAIRALEWFGLSRGIVVPVQIDDTKGIFIASNDDGIEVVTNAEMVELKETAFEQVEAVLSGDLEHTVVKPTYKLNTESMNERLTLTSLDRFDEAAHAIEDGLGIFRPDEAHVEHDPDIYALHKMGFAGVLLQSWEDDHLQVYSSGIPEGFFLGYWGRDLDEHCPIATATREWDDNFSFGEAWQAFGTRPESREAMVHFDTWALRSGLAYPITEGNRKSCIFLVSRKERLRMTAAEETDAIVRANLVLQRFLGGKLHTKSVLRRRATAAHKTGWLEGELLEGNHKNVPTWALNVAQIR